ncbi:MAG: 2-phospho-L-lactate transferase CofD family protein, partial [Pseudomonadota bacterium]
GWGVEGETWHALEGLKTLGGESWFLLGDRDLATHLYRTQALRSGLSLTAVMHAMARRLSIPTDIWPMTDEPVRTVVHSEEGDLPFQEYFVKRRCEPGVSGFTFTGVEAARPQATILAQLSNPALEAVILAPSNPFVSIDPILAVPGYCEALRDCPAPVIAVSPIVSGLAIKGPAAKMMAELSLPVTAHAVAKHYADRYPGLIDHFVLDTSDAKLAPEIERSTGLQVQVADTIMKSRDDKLRLARHLLDTL